MNPPELPPLKYTVVPEPGQYAPASAEKASVGLLGAVVSTLTVVDVVEVAVFPTLSVARCWYW